MANSTLRSPHDMPNLHRLPDLVVDKILRLLPTKPAVQLSFLSKEWQGAISSCPSLDFNEDDDFERRNLNSYGHFQLQHRKFINFLKGYLDYLEKYDQKEHLGKLSLHMRMYGRRDSPTITNWLKYASHRGLKELDISACFDDKQYRTITEYLVRSRCYLYRFPWAAIASAKFLTSLRLECVRVPHALVGAKYTLTGVRDAPLFPSLKTLYFKTARFSHEQYLDTVLFQCPSIEYLSLIECSIGNSKCYVRCSSLKYLEIKFCRLNVIRVDRAFNLESFTYFSLPYSKCEKMILNSAFNLKYINVCVHWFIRRFSLLGCHSALEASITSQWIKRFEFFDGYLSANVFVKALEATILVGELLDQEWFSLSYSTYFPRLLSFLNRCSYCKEIKLYNQDAQALIIPKHYRLTFPPPLPQTCTLQAWMPEPPTMGSRDYLELEDSLRWIAPSAKTLIRPVDVEEDRKKVELLATPGGRR